MVTYEKLQYFVVTIGSMHKLWLDALCAATDGLWSNYFSPGKLDVITPYQWQVVKVI